MSLPFSRKYSQVRHSILFILCIALCSCGSKYSECAEKSSTYPDIFPDYVEITAPINIAPLNFEVKDARHILAKVSVGGKKIADIAGENVIEFDENLWRNMLAKAAGKNLEITVSVWSEKHPGGIEYKPFKINVSNDKIDPWIAYRLIPPGYELWNNMGIYQRNLESYKQEAIVKNTQNNKGCVNCHSFCNYNSKNFMFHARGEGGGTILTLDGNTQKIQIEKLEPGKSATYPYWHPSGKYIAFSSNVTRQSFYGISRNKLEVYDLSSDLIIYDVRNNRILTDPRFCESKEWETFPAFSPDGKYLYFCTASLDIADSERQKLQSYFEKLKYALVRVPFDEKTGKLGDEITTLYNPEEKGGSVSFPRISPDGKFLMYTEADCATFPIQHAEADLKMVDLNTMQEVNTSIINSDCSDSYHSWSSNGRWLMFSSRRIDGKYTRLFFAHCDKNGKLTKPFLLPQKDPELNGTLMYAYNIPEFITDKVVMDKEKTAELFKDN